MSEFAKCSLSLTLCPLGPGNPGTPGPPRFPCKGKQKLCQLKNCPGNSRCGNAEAKNATLPDSKLASKV